jgi:hypothetical protein
LFELDCKERKGRKVSIHPEDPSAAQPRVILGVSLAKHALSTVEGAQRGKGSKKKFFFGLGAFARSRED